MPEEMRPYGFYARLGVLPQTYPVASLHEGKSVINAKVSLGF
jgi:hypothetical protein